MCVLPVAGSTNQLGPHVFGPPVADAATTVFWTKSQVAPLLVDLASPQWLTAPKLPAV